MASDDRYNRDWEQNWEVKNEIDVQFFSAPESVRKVDRWVGVEAPSRDEVPGRNQGEGYWLEAQTAYALQNWGYDAIACRDRIWGQEVDLIGCQWRGKRGLHPKILIECKDHAEGAVTPADIWRLIAISMTVGCQPAIAHSHRITRAGHRIMQYWNVVDLPLPVVLRGSKPPREESRIGDKELPEILSKTYYNRQINPSHWPRYYRL